MDSTLPTYTFWDFALGTVPDVMDMEPSLAGVGLRNADDFTSTAFGHSLEPSLAVEMDMEPDLADVGLGTADNFTSVAFGHSLEPSLADEMWLNAMQPTSAGAGLKQDMSMEPNIVVSNPQVQSVQLLSTSLKRPVRGTRWASKEDWMKARPLITRLYPDKRNTLKDVMASVEREHGFKATPKMYKDRIKEWGLDKNNKEHEMAAILRKKTQRAAVGKQSLLKVRGRTISLEEIQRYFRHKGITLDKACARHAGASTPPGISCSTPPLSPMLSLSVPRSPTTPRSLAVPEQLLYNIDQYMTVSFSSGSWIALEDRICINASSGRDRYIHDFNTYCKTGIELLQRGQFAEGRRTLSTACGLVQRIIKTEHPLTMEFLLDTLLTLIRDDFLDIFTQLSVYISRMARILLDAEHPWSQICRLIGSIDPDRSEETIIQCWKCVIKVYVQELGEFHRISLRSEMNLNRYWSSTLDLVLAEQRLRKVLVQSREVNGFPSRGSFELMDNLWINLYNQAKYSAAESTACELLSCARESGDYSCEVVALERVAIAQYNLGKLDSAEMNINEAEEMLSRHWEDSDPWVLRMMVRMQRRFEYWGLEQKAAELQPEIERRMSLQKYDDDF